MCVCPASPHQIATALELAFWECDQQFMAMLLRPVPQGTGVSNPIVRGRINAGCCALAAVVKGEDLYVANVGDCRAVLACKRTLVGACRG